MPATFSRLGKPQDLDDHPVNQFVAGFIGSPAMNFFNSTRVCVPMVRSNLPSRIKHSRFPGHVANVVRDYENRVVTLGLRPEDFNNASNAQSGQTLQGIVDVVEHLGNEQLLYVKVANSTVLARVDTSVHTSVGDNITLAVDAEKMHVFDPESTKALV